MNVRCDKHDRYFDSHTGEGCPECAATIEPQEGDLLHTMMQWARTPEGRSRLTDSFRPHYWACAKRAAEPGNEFVNCLHWCGDIEHCYPISWWVPEQTVSGEGSSDVAVPPTEESIHPDDLAVNNLAAAMKVKLAAARAKGRSGWENKDECSREHLIDLMHGHIAKGDPVDVANFACFLFNRGESTSAPTPDAQEAREALAELVACFDNEPATLAIRWVAAWQRAHIAAGIAK